MFSANCVQGKSKVTHHMNELTYVLRSLWSPQRRPTFKTLSVKSNVFITIRSWNTVTVKNPDQKEHLHNKIRKTVSSLLPFKYTTYGGQFGKEPFLQ